MTQQPPEEVDVDEMFSFTFYCPFTTRTFSNAIKRFTYMNSFATAKLVNMDTQEDEDEAYILGRPVRTSRTEFSGPMWALAFQDHTKFWVQFTAAIYPIRNTTKPPHLNISIQAGRTPLGQTTMGRKLENREAWKTTLELTAEPSKLKIA